jgi:hypothetical protein
MPIKWEEVNIKRDNGESVKGKAPVIISASRSTDIPAFYSKWLIDRLNKGYVVWYNPFNKTTPVYISFKNAKLFVFWTKNPEPLIPYLNEFDKKNIDYYFQYTLNDYENEGFEPNVPNLTKRIEVFKKLSDKIGKEKVIWRFDPLLVTPELNVRGLLHKIWMLGNRLKGYTDKLVVSFVDVKTYKKVQNNLIRELSYYTKESVGSAEPGKDQIYEISKGLSDMKKRWSSEGWDISIATCGEKIDLEKYSIDKNKCVDDDLIRKEFSNNQSLMNFLDTGTKKSVQKELFSSPKKIQLKDSGQRKECGCIFSKDIGMYNTCSHFCMYCYANSSKNTVIKNSKLHSQHSESIIV